MGCSVDLIMAATAVITLVARDWNVYQQRRSAGACADNENLWLMVASGDLSQPSTAPRTSLAECNWQLPNLPCLCVLQLHATCMLDMAHSSLRTWQVHQQVS